jgi:hypothetical protein
LREQEKGLISLTRNLFLVQLTRQIRRRDKKRNIVMLLLLCPEQEAGSEFILNIYLVYGLHVSLNSETKPTRVDSDLFHGS